MNNQKVLFKAVEPVEQEQQPEPALRLCRPCTRDDRRIANNRDELRCQACGRLLTWQDDFARLR